MKRGDTAFSILNNSHFLKVLSFASIQGLQNFHGGVLNLKFVRAFEHRSMAVGLPYVLHGLLNDDLAEQCSLAYLTWRMLLDNELFTEGPVSTGDTCYVSTGPNL